MRGTRPSGPHRLRSVPLLAIAVVALVVSGDVAVADTRSPVTVQHVTVDVDRSMGAMLGGRVDVRARFRVANTGPAPVTPLVRIRVESQIGGGVRSAPTSLVTLAPGAQVRVTRTIRSVLPFGSVRVVVSAQAGGRTTTATATKAVVPWLLVFVALMAAAGVLALRARPAAPPTGAQSVTSSRARAELRQVVVHHAHVVGAAALLRGR